MGDPAQPKHINQAYAKKHFIEVSVNQNTWEVLYHDPRADEYWKEYFPQSEAHGGGISSYIKITKEQAKSEFNVET